MAARCGGIVSGSLRQNALCMARVTVAVLGPPEVRVDGELISVDTRKAIALLTYLVVTGRRHRRDSLAALFWPEYDQQRARAALRRTLSALRAAVGSGVLDVSRESLGVRVHDDLWVDIEEFDRLVEAGDADSLRRAVDLYRGDFLEGFSLRDSAGFDEWQLFEGETLRRRLAGALHRLAAACAEDGDYQQAIGHARRWLALDPLNEEAHRRLMVLYAWSGDRPAAVHQYRECLRILEEELGVPPVEETTSLYEAILVGEVPDRPAPLRPKRPTPKVPEPFPLVGREEELARMLETYGAARGGILLLEGEAGVGKTRLAHEFLALVGARGGAILTGRCYEGERGLAYGPISAALRQALVERPEAVEQVPEPWAGEMARLLPELAGRSRSHPGRSARGRLLEGLRRSFQELLGGDPPGVLFVDDVQWADGASEDLLVYICRRLEESSFWVLLTRGGEGAGSRLRRLAAEGSVRRRGALIAVERLDRAAVQELVEGALPESQELAEVLYQETEGVPFFLVEWLKAIAEGFAPGGPLPGGLREVLKARVAEVGEVAGQVLEAAAVIGRSFEYATLRETSGRSEQEVIEALDELAWRGLVRSLPGQASFDFVHARLRETVYQELTLPRRRLLHRRVAEALLASAEVFVVLAQVAHHYRASGDNELAARHFVLAGERARSLHANAEAIAHFEAALALGHPDRAGLHGTLGDLRTLAGDYRGAQADYEMAAALSVGEALGRVEHRLGNLHARRGEWKVAERRLAAAAALLEKEGRARLLSDWSLVAHRLGRPDEALELAEEALGLSEEADDVEARAQAHNILGILAHRWGDLPEARGHLARSLSLAELLDDLGGQVAALNNLALVEVRQGVHEEAIGLLQRALDLCRLQGDRHREAALLNNLADTLRGAGREEEAMSRLKEGVAIFAEIGSEEGKPAYPEIWKLVEW